jgi:threonine synthase
VSARASFNPWLIDFVCAVCGQEVGVTRLVPICPACGQLLLARYDFPRIASAVDRDDLNRFGTDLWRFRAVLPFAFELETPRLGEGGTPLLSLGRLASDLDLDRLWLKEESGNPTHSFKARGLALAVAGALVLQKTAIALPSAGNAGSAAAAYAAAAGLRCRITMPEDTPHHFVIEQRALGAEVRQVRGSISVAGQALADFAPSSEWWNVATFREPFRLEGKKTLGYEIGEQTGWQLPEVIFYPTGGGTGLVGMWRAFAELRELGWIENVVPRLIAVQSAGCAPVVRAFEQGAAEVEPWVDGATMASGLRVPSPFAGRIILKAIRESQGTAIAVSEDEMLDCMKELAHSEGVFACPEGATTLAALKRLRQAGEIKPGSRVLIFNTGSGLKYSNAWERALARGRAPVGL